MARDYGTSDKRDEINERFYKIAGKWGTTDEWNEEQTREILKLMEKHTTQYTRCVRDHARQRREPALFFRKPKIF